MKLMSRFHSSHISLLVLSVLQLSTITAVNAQNKKWVVPAGASSLQNPVVPNTQSVTAGKTLYKSYCTPCHGAKGKGDGTAASSLQVKPADHTSSIVQGQTDGAIFWEIGEGHNPMPSYKATLNEQQRWQLVNYIRTLSKSEKK